MSAERKPHQKTDAHSENSSSEADPYQRLTEAFAPNESYTHDQAGQALPAYVMDELLGRKVARLYPELHRHLLNCRQCAETHVALLADFANEPEWIDIPQPDLAFLPAATNKLVELFRDVRIATRWAVEQIVVNKWPELKEELGITERIFFRQIDLLGDDFVFQKGAAQALGFGEGEALPSQRILATAYRVNQTLKEQSGQITLADETAFQGHVRMVAEEAATEMGLRGYDQQRFVDAYVAWIVSQFIEN